MCAGGILDLSGEQSARSRSQIECIDPSHVHDDALGRAQDGRTWNNNGHLVLGAGLAQRNCRFMTEINRRFPYILPEEREE